MVCNRIVCDRTCYGHIYLVIKRVELENEKCIDNETVWEFMKYKLAKYYSFKYVAYRGL